MRGVLWNPGRDGPPADGCAKRHEQEESHSATQPRLREDASDGELGQFPVLLRPEARFDALTRLTPAVVSSDPERRVLHHSTNVQQQESRRDADHEHVAPTRWAKWIHQQPDS